MLIRITITYRIEKVKYLHLRIKGVEMHGRR